MSGAPSLPPLPAEGQWAIVGRQFRRHRPAVWGWRVVRLLALLAAAAPLLACQVPLVWREPGGALRSPWCERLFDVLTWEHGVDRFFNAVLVALVAYGLVRLVLLVARARPAAVARARRWTALAALPFALLLASGLALTRSLPTEDFARDPAMLERLAGQGRAWAQATLARAGLAAQAEAVRRAGEAAAAPPTVAALRGAAGDVRAWAAGRDDAASSDPLDAANALDRAASALERAAQARAAEREAGDTWSVWRTPVPYGYRDQREGREEQFVGAFAFASGHLLGTDLQGRDVFARILYGTRISLTIGIVAVGIYVAIGTLLGAVAGYLRGKVDLLIMRVVEVVMSIPALFLIMLVVALTDNRSIFLIMLAIGLIGWTGICRLIRGQFLKETAMDYVLAAKAAGLPTTRIMLRHVLPNAFAPVLVAATFGVASAILTENTLAFIGLGDVTVPSWGRILDDGRVTGYWHLILPPTVAIFLTVTALNLVGDGVRDALDPKLRN